MTEQVVQRVVPAPLDPDVWSTSSRIIEVRPALNERWFKRKRDDRVLPFTKTGGATSPCLYRLRDVDALLDAFIIRATAGPLAELEERKAELARQLLADSEVI